MWFYRYLFGGVYHLKFSMEGGHRTVFGQQNDLSKLRAADSYLFGMTIPVHNIIAMIRGRDGF